MSTVIDSLPPDSRELFTDIIGDRDPGLLAALRDRQKPDLSQRVSVMEILSTEFSHNLQPDDEPTERGKAIDDLLGAFLLHWPINET
jgi:hypothetical protein